MTVRLIQVANVSQSCQKEQLRSLFAHFGRIDDIQLYPDSDTLAATVATKVAYIKFDRSELAHAALQLTNTIFMEKSLVCTLVRSGKLPDETEALQHCSPHNPNISLIAGGFTWPNTVVHRMIGTGPTSTIETFDPALTEKHLKPYPVLPGTTDPILVEEIRRTIYVSNISPHVSLENLNDLFTQVGEVRFIRFAGDENAPTKNAYIEFGEQPHVVRALCLNGLEFAGRLLKVNHSTHSIVKPATNKQIFVNTEKRSISRHRSKSPAKVPKKRSRSPRQRSRSRKRSRSKKRSSKSPRKRSRSSKKRSRSKERDKRRRSTSKGKKRTRSRERKPSRSKETKKRRSRSKETGATSQSKTSKSHHRSRSRKRSSSRSKVVSSSSVAAASKSSRRRSRSVDKKDKKSSKDKRRSKSKDRHHRRSSPSHKSHKSSKEEASKGSKEDKESRSSKRKNQSSSVKRDYDEEEKMSLEMAAASEGSNGKGDEKSHFGPKVPVVEPGEEDTKKKEIDTMQQDVSSTSDDSSSSSSNEDDDDDDDEDENVMDVQ